MIEALLKEHPVIKSQLDSIFKQISYSLPLNSLYIDLTNDEKIKNDSDDSISDIIVLMKTIVSSSPATSRQHLIESLMMTEPFCNYTEDIEAANKKGDFND